MIAIVLAALCWKLRQLSERINLEGHPKGASLTILATFSAQARWRRHRKWPESSESNLFFLLLPLKHESETATPSFIHAALTCSDAYSVQPRSRERAR